MNKKIIAVATGVALFLVGCSSNSAANNSTNSSANTANKESLPSVSTLLKKADAKQDKQENVHIVMKTNIVTEDPNEAVSTIDADFSKDPNEAKGNVDVLYTGKTTSFEMYLTDTKMYAISNQKWIDATEFAPSYGINMMSMRAQVDCTKINDPALLKSGKVTKKGGTYILKMVAKGEDAENIMSKGSTKMGSDIPGFETNKLTYIMVVDKKTYLPKKMTMMVDARYQGEKYDQKIETKFSQWNNSIVLEPDLG